MPKQSFDLHRLPAWLQYLISLAVVVAVVAVAWWSSGGRAAPAWITDYLIPLLGWALIALLAYAIIRRIIRR
jgi:hypothetical protein